MLGLENIVQVRLRFGDVLEGEQHVAQPDVKALSEWSTTYGNRVVSVTISLKFTHKVTYGIQVAVTLFHLTMRGL